MENSNRWTKTILMPLVVSIVGIIGTAIIGVVQHNGAKKIVNSELKHAEFLVEQEKDIAFAAIFADKITSDSEEERTLALNILGLVDGELSEELLQLVPARAVESEPNKELANTLRIEATQRGKWFPVVGSFRDLNGAKSFASEIHGLSEKYLLEIYLAENAYYAVTLGGYLNQEEARKRVGYAKERGIANDAYEYKSKFWGQDLLNK